MLDTEPETSRRRRAGERGPARGIIGLVVLLVILAGCSRRWGWFWHALGSRASSGPVAFTVAAGRDREPDRRAAWRASGVIRSALGFRLLAKVRGVDINSEAGDTRCPRT